VSASAAVPGMTRTGSPRGKLTATREHSTSSRLRHEPVQVRQARKQAAKAHGGWGHVERAGRPELIVSEVAANAIRHGSTGRYRRSVPVPGTVSARRRDSAAPEDSGAPSDDDLLRRYVEGDPGAFGALFRRHRDRLWAVAIRTLREPEEAADALQDAMVSALRRAGTFRGDSAVMTWLYRIVVNACLDRMRWRAARPASGGHDDDALDTLAGRGRMSDSAGTTDTALDVRAALRRLVPEQHAALVLVDMLDYPIADAAEMLGVSEGAVKSRAARGRARLLPMLAHLRPGRNRRDQAARG
jgi:RNA polymerase sigma-70 factor (ECF subfamily)